MGDKDRATLPTRPLPMEIDPATTAVVVVDMQNGFVSAGGSWSLAGVDTAPIGSIVARIAALLDAARHAGMTIVYLTMGLPATPSADGMPAAAFGGTGTQRWRHYVTTNATGHTLATPGETPTSPTWNRDIVAALAPQPGDAVIAKPTFGGFHRTELDATLRAAGIDTLLFTGCTTSVCVETTLREAVVREYRCVLIDDCVAEPVGANLARTNHDATALLTELVLGWVTTAADVIGALGGADSEPPHRTPIGDDRGVTDDFERPSAVLVELITGYQRSQQVIVAAELGLADLLAGGPRSVASLAETTGTDAAALRRLLRGLTACGLLALHDDDTVESTPLAALLQTSVEGSLRTLALAQRDFYPVWGELGYSVHTGQPSFERVYGQPNWAYREQHPEANKRFNGLMAQHAQARAADLVDSGRLPSSGTIVDVGGGNGTLLAIVLAKHPQLRGVLFDQPHVLTEAPNVLVDAGVADRCDVVSGDFFAEVPSGGAAYILSGVLCDWPDDQATRILHTCRQAMGADARLIVVDGSIGTGRRSSTSTAIDLQLMLTNAGGGIRTERDWRSLFDAAGLTIQTTVTTGPVWDIIDAVATDHS